MLIEHNEEMDSGILERLRLREADMENHVDSIVQQMLLREGISNKRHILVIDHFIARRLKDITAISEELADLYLDDDDIVELRNAPSGGSEVRTAALKDFEAKVADIREHRSLSIQSLPPIKLELSRPSPFLLEEIFSPAERYGRCFHLERNYQLYYRFLERTTEIGSRCVTEGDGGREPPLLNPSLSSSSTPPSFLVRKLKEEIQTWCASWEPSMTYLTFLTNLSTSILKEIPAHRKLIGFQPYREWIFDLLEYLQGFYRRLFPLDEEHLSQLMVDVELKADEYWSALQQSGDIPWVNPLHSNSDDQTGPSMMHSKKSSGLAVPSSLRSFLESFSLWPLAYIQSVLLPIVEKAGVTGSATPDLSLRHLPRSVEEIQSVCYAEAKIVALLKSVLFDTFQYTISCLTRNQSKTLEEIERERIEEDEAFEKSLKNVQKQTQNTVEGTIAQAAQYYLEAAKDCEKEAEGKVDALKDEESMAEQLRNTLIGDDGKPIPRWLAQLQQLDKIFTCDVCGGTVYRGPKLFREHFGGDRHAEGLRRVGVTEHLKAYEGLTSMQEVIQMRDQLERMMVGTRKRLREEREMEEIQDSTGKVVSSGAYAQYQHRRAQKMDMGGRR